jgi:hypothetical protein
MLLTETKLAVYEYVIAFWILTGPNVSPSRGAIETDAA